MTELRIEPYELPSADLGPENPLPAFRAPQDDAEITCHESVPEEDRRYLGWQIGTRILPYRMQDGYNREKRPRAFTSIVLENEFLKATVLPELDGRIASLVHKPTGRELLDRNPVFQPANLALRGAWISGGIEWNTCLLGHYYLTCSPVFAARTVGLEGEPALRIYEWDRVKRFPWQVDLVLPPGSRFLFARVRIVNPHDYEMPMYWWTNIAVPERPGHRTLVPADTAIYNHPEGFRVAELPNLPRSVSSDDGDSFDATYATNHPRARELFCRIPDDSRHWITTLDECGAGFVQASTSRLRGRKQFVWGTGQGGQRWQEYLAAPGSAYIEIQAGLARTQIESVPMPAQAHWTWTEAYGLLEADAAKVHSSDWTEARGAAEDALDRELPQSELDALHESLDRVTAGHPANVLAQGSGWGALERRRVSIQGGEDRVPAELVFDDSTIGPDQRPWLDLLEHGALPDGGPADGPGQFMVQPEWREMLERSVALGRSDHWLAWYHLGIMRMEERDTDGAREAWEESLRRKRTSWALRNLSVLESRAGNAEAALDLLREAWEVGPVTPHLAIEYAQALAQLARHDDLLAFVDCLPADIGANERIQMMWAKAAIETGDLDALDGFFDREFAKIREGEVTLTDLWFRLHEKKLAAALGAPIDADLRARVAREFPPPVHIDFRMS